jgi:PAT family beta-lactamase induction signal transducer AmpG
LKAVAGDRAPPRWMRAIRALSQPKMAAMLLLALAAGLPYGAVLGTLNAWLTEEGVTPSTIGVLSFIVLAYSYKFIWAPGFQAAWFPRLPLSWPGRLGPRRAWLATFEWSIAVLLGLLAMSRPGEAIGYVALIGVATAILSATHDIVLDAWRIEVAETEEEADLLSAIYQFGYRLSALLTGAVALVVAQRAGWPATYALIAAGMALASVGALIAPEPRAYGGQTTDDRRRETFADALSPRWRGLALATVAIGWTTAIILIVSFVVASLTQTPPPSAGVFTREAGPVIVVLSVILPSAVAAFLLTRAPESAPVSGDRPARAVDRVLLSVFQSILDPLMDLIRRLRWGALLVLALVLSYRFVDLVWGAFAFPFYLGEGNGALGHSNDDVAIASKTIGVIMTMIGSGVGAGALLVIGRLPCLVIGAILASVTNLLFADLAYGAQGMDAFLSVTGLDSAYAALGADLRLARLITAVAGENIAVGFASVASVAFLTSIVNPKFAAVQYALLASLTMLIGSLGRAPLGAMIETDGYGDVFVFTALLGSVAVILSMAEWARQRRLARLAAVV